MSEGEAGNADSARAGEERGDPHRRTESDDQDRQERSAEQPFDEDAGPPGPETHQKVGYKKCAKRWAKIAKKWVTNQKSGSLLVKMRKSAWIAIGIQTSKIASEGLTPRSLQSCE